MEPSREFLFVGGNARSGTTALVALLNGHRDVFLMVERYLTEFLKGQLTAAHYARDRILADSRGLPHLAEGEDMAARLDRARLMGDKFPALSAGFDLLDARFPGARLVYIVRNPFSVVESYQARFDDGSWKRDASRGIRQWNDSMRLGLARVQAGKPLIVVRYETLFRSEPEMLALFAALGLDPAGLDRERLRFLSAKAQDLAETAVPRNEALRMLVSDEADFGAYRALLRTRGLLAQDDTKTRPASRTVAAV